ncbi:MAG TPA: flavin reductase family protein [Solirubrobacteraceae bacterium]|nr:flavin reductase family protein [Solirubrobacteraceae bacterium]
MEGPATDPHAFRDALALFPVGVTVVSTQTPDGPYGTTVTAFSALSLDPPMVLAALAADSRVLGFIRDRGRFAVSFLRDGQASIARALAATTEKAVSVCDWEVHGGMPVVAGARVQLVADLSDVLPGGDHFVIYGRVSHSVLADRDRAPLVYYDRAFSNVT